MVALPNFFPNDRTLKLRDGRQLGYTEHGDPTGTPVFFFHGNPGSRLMRHPDETIAESLGIRIIAPDRPGYGLSDFQPNRKILDFPSDIEQLADALQIDQFAIFGVSAGGLYTAATAYALPERVTSAAIVSGAAPFDRDNPYDGVNDSYKAAYRAAKMPAWALKPLLRRQMKTSIKHPLKALAASFKYLSSDDKKLLSHPEYAMQVHGYRLETTRQGIDGMVHEAGLIVASWGFALEHIETPMHLWYWDADTIVPQQMGRYLEELLPNSVGHFLPNGGHFSIFTYWREILTDLIT